MRLLPLLLFCACASGGEPVPAHEGAVRFRLATYNMNFGLAGQYDGVRAIAATSADIVVLQETNDEWERVIVDTLQRTYPHHRFQGPVTEMAAGGMGVLSKWPIVKIEQLDSKVGPFFAWRIVIDAPGGAMQILDVHLHPPMDTQSGSWVVGYFSTRPIREAEAKEHFARLDRSLPTIVAGDFNEEDEGKAVAVFKGFADAVSRFQPDKDTWHWQVGTTELKFRLDHVLFEETAFRAVGADVLHAGQSDHFPVWVDFIRTRTSESPTAAR